MNLIILFKIYISPFGGSMRRVFLSIVFILLMSNINLFSQFSVQNGNTTQNLQSVYFINQDVGFIAGFQTILKTTDGGITWEQKYSGGVYFYYIKFFSNNIGIAVGLAGSSGTVIFQSTNNGENWSQTGNYIYTVTDFYFISPLTGWINNSGQILKTTDGGASWISQHSPGYALTSIY